MKFQGIRLLCETAPEVLTALTASILEVSDSYPDPPRLSCEILSPPCAALVFKGWLSLG